MHKTMLLLALTGLTLAGCTPPPPRTATPNFDTPGWTGRSYVVGSQNTVNGSAAGTYYLQKWGVAPGR